MLQQERGPSSTLSHGDGGSIDAPEKEPLPTADHLVKIEVYHLSVCYQQKQVLSQITFALPAERMTALVGPSGSGKTTLLRALPRLHDLTPAVQISGEIVFEGENSLLFGRDGAQVMDLRQRIGIVFQQPNIFPLSVFENVAYGLRLSQRLPRRTLHETVTRLLERVALWEDVKDRLWQDARSLSQGQQKRLCLARALAVEPDVLLIDEPWETGDPETTQTMDVLLAQLKQRHTLLIATSHPQEALRHAQFIGFLLAGELIEYAPTEQIITCPRDWRTAAFLSGRRARHA